MAFQPKHQTYFSTGGTYHFSLPNMRKRSMRKPITVLSIILEAVFIVILLTTTSILQAVSKQLGITPSPEAFQYWITVIAIFVWGGGIVSPLVMSTAERSREVGVMKSLGATNTAILKMLLIESASIGLLGGILGAAIGWLITIAIYSLQLGFAVILMVPLLSYLFNFMLAVTASLLLSITAAAYPAYHVAKMGPVDALESET